jgi:hypothetical protein
MSPSRVLLGLALSLSALALPARDARPAERPLRVVTIAGGAEVYKSSGSTWSEAVLRAALEPGDAARTLSGRLTLTTPSGQAVRLGPGSRVTLDDGGAPEQPTPVRLDGGSVWAAVMVGSPPREQLEVRTAAATIVVRGSGVGITLGRDGSVLVRVHHGTAECAGPAVERRWTRVLTDEQELSVSAAGVPAETRKLNRDKLEAAWVKWNEDQDVAGGYGARPAPR